MEAERADGGMQPRKDGKGEANQQRLYERDTARICCAKLGIDHDRCP